MVVCTTETCWWLVIWNKIHFIKVHSLVLCILQFNAWEWNILNLQNTELETPNFLGFAPTIWVPVIFKTYWVNHTFFEGSGGTKWETQMQWLLCALLFRHHMPCIIYVGQAFLVRLWIISSKDCGSCGLFYMLFIHFLKWTNENHRQHMSELFASEQSSYLGSPKTNWLQCSVPPTWHMNAKTNIAATAFLL
jgi:hypothetical protein